jgi:hypothetical protein
MVGWLMNDGLKRIWKERAVPFSKYYYRNLPEGTEKSRENPQDNRCHGRVWNWLPPGYKYRTLYVETPIWWYKFMLVMDLSWCYIIKIKYEIRLKHSLCVKNRNMATARNFDSRPMCKISSAYVSPGFNNSRVMCCLRRRRRMEM